VHGMRIGSATALTTNARSPRRPSRTFVGDRTERACRRGDAFEKRRALMTDWATYLASQPAEVVPIRILS